MYQLNDTYNQDFFKLTTIDNTPLARYLAPIITKKLNLKSAIDFGCATGYWVKALLDCGVEAIGIEGSEHAKAYLMVPPERVIFADLRFPFAEKISKKYTFDLALSIEVAEHIEDDHADTYVKTMTTFNSKHIIMTAAPPGQEGIAHINLQPKSYWIEKFKYNGYILDQELLDFLAKKIEEGRRWEDAPDEYKLPKELDWADHHPVTKGFKGVWIPFWLPENLLCFKKA